MNGHKVVLLMAQSLHLNQKIQYKEPTTPLYVVGSLYSIILPCLMTFLIERDNIGT